MIVFIGRITGKRAGDRSKKFDSKLSNFYRCRGRHDTDV